MLKVHRCTWAPSPSGGPEPGGNSQCGLKSFSPSTGQGTAQNPVLLTHKRRGGTLSPGPAVPGLVCNEATGRWMSGSNSVIRVEGNPP